MLCPAEWTKRVKRECSTHLLYGFIHTFFFYTFYWDLTFLSIWMNYLYRHAMTFSKYFDWFLVIGIYIYTVSIIAE